MDTITYQRVFERMASLAGLDPLFVDEPTWRQWRNLAEGRLGQWLWLAAEWPEVCPDVEVALVDEVDAGGTVVRRLATLPRGVAAVLAVHDAQPEDPRARPLEYRRLSTGQLSFTPGATSQATVWLTYRLAAPRLRGNVYDGERSYTAGQQVFYGEDFYETAERAEVNESPAAYPAKWTRVEIPARLGEALARGVIADWPGNEDEGMEGKADEALLRQLLDLETREQQGGGQMVVKMNP